MEAKSNVTEKHLVKNVTLQNRAEQVQNHANANPAPEQDSTTENMLQTSIIFRKRRSVPVQEKFLLTLEEAAEYTGLGLKKLRDISNHESCKFVLWNGSKRMFIRAKLEEYLENAYSI